MMVTARSTPIRDGRQMCSSTPRLLTPFNRAGSLVRALASTSIERASLIWPHLEG
jgi:hypothetical protein